MKTPLSGSLWTENVSFVQEKGPVSCAASVVGPTPCTVILPGRCSTMGRDRTTARRGDRRATRGDRFPQCLQGTGVPSPRPGRRADLLGERNPPFTTLTDYTCS